MRSNACSAGPEAAVSVGGAMTVPTCVAAAATRKAPVPPREPRPGDCCGQGCTVCVWDVYDRKLAKYEHQLAEWKLYQARTLPQTQTQAVQQTLPLGAVGASEAVPAASR